MISLWRDTRVAWRFLLKRRASTAIAVVTLGITIGLCTIALGIVDQAFWRAAPGERGRELVTVYNARPAAPHFQTLSLSDYTDVRDRLQDGVDLAAFVRIESTLTGGEWPERVTGEIVTGNYFRVLGAAPVAGRFLEPADDDAPDGAQGIVLSHALWRRRFAADREVIGRRIRVGRSDFTVLGIAPETFRSPAWPAEFWMPIAAARTIFGSDIVARPDAAIFQTIGRRLPGVNDLQLQARAVFATYASKDGWRLTVLPAEYLRFWPAYRASVAQFLGVFAGISACVLIIACANLAGLLMARAGERQRELALRQALGATRRQLFRRLAAESLILVAGGGVLGMLVALWAAQFVARVPLPVSAQLGVTFDARLAAIALAVSFVASILFTGLSAVRGLRTDVRSVLAASAGTLALRPAAGRALVVAQVALSCTMLTVGGLLLRSAWQIERVDIGLDPSDRLMARVSLYDRRDTAATGDAFYERLQENLERQPQVEGVALGWHAPLGSIRVTGSFTLSGASTPIHSRYDIVSPRYFETLGIDILSGREFDRHDRRGAEPVAIVNDVLAAQFADGAIGHSIRLSTESAPRRIVGIARAVKYNGITEAAQPFVYLPLAQVFRPEVHVYLRTTSAGALDLLRRELAGLDPGIPIADVRTMAAQADIARAAPRMSALVSTAAAAIAVFLALIGVYGVLTTSVEQRRRELAIRAALGASRRILATQVIVEGSALTGVGLAIGLAVSAAAGRLVSGQLFAVQPHDPLVFAIVPLVVVFTSAASWVAPTRRAANLDPVEVLRD